MQALAVARPAVASGGGRDAYLRRRHGIDKVEYAHPDLEPILRDTWGLLLYEDDCLSVIEALTGWPAPEADWLRRELADKETGDAAAERFLAATERNNVPRRAAELVSTQLRNWEAYGFCKAHAANYGLLAWSAARLKARHPLAFWVGSLNHHKGSYRRRVAIESIKRSGLGILGPCVNRSRFGFTEEVSAIRCGLGAIRGLRDGTPTTVVEEREKGGAFSSLDDFRGRVPLPADELAMLVRVGAFDFTGKGREVLLKEAGVARLGHLPPWWMARHAPEPFPLEDLLPYAPLLGQWQAEWELLGFICGPSLMSLARQALPPGLVDSRLLPEMVGQTVRLAGMVASEQEEADPPGKLILEDEYGMVEAIVPAGKALPSGPLVLALGKVEERFKVPLLAVSNLEPPLPGGAQSTMTCNRLAGMTAPQRASQNGTKVTN
jgi:DNA polymerase III alpha subunit